MQSSNATGLGQYIGTQYITQAPGTAVEFAARTGCNASAHAMASSIRRIGITLLPVWNFYPSSTLICFVAY